MSDPIRPYVLSAHQSGLTIGLDGRLAWPAGVTRRHKVAIYGAGGWRGMLRDGIFDNDDWIIFSLNNFWNTSRDSTDALRADVWWELHQISPDPCGPEAGRAIQDRWDMRWLATCPVPIYVAEPYPINRKATVWPVADYARLCGRKYIACTFAAQLMTVLAEGFGEVAIYGLDLLAGTRREATVEASCVAYWLGVLEGRGVKITISDHDDGRAQFLLTHPFVYGIEYWLERRWVERYLRRWPDLPEAI